MTVFVITFLLGCLSVMTVRGRQGNWPAGMPVARPRLVAVGGTYEGGQGRPSDAYVVQERLIAAARGVGGGDAAHAAAALALGAVVAARPQHGDEGLDDCAQAAHRAVRNAALRDPAMPELVSTLDLVVLERAENPRLRFAHVGDGEIWHCPKGGEPHRLTTPHVFGEGPPLRGVGLPPALNPETGSVALRPGDRVAIVTEGAVKALGTARMRELFTGGASPAACLDRMYDEMAAVEPKGDATVIIAEFVTA
ncbi:serine/threonine protein phosphatase PrpC [Nonomuraea thailandensis]|uniref:Serine/threonine protein phosphatase PrpC n=1 Tax=Nonomuraea thailandensis TaxID=1188745 RepID=A0A9X2K4F5_9ACTN|nr:protein phosphatase 2C domain-containing protein [Nonomuraea thailandensis]MCP2360427.1 serine/threonine protein phosphatase PrpC [Nonomuraea thailandensis]